MEWYEFSDKIHEWSTSTIKSKIYQLEDIDSDELEAVMSVIGTDLSDQLIRKAIRLKTPINIETFSEIEELMSFDVANELRDYLHLDRKLNPFESMLQSMEDIDINEFRKNVDARTKEIEEITENSINFNDEDTAFISYEATPIIHQQTLDQNTHTQVPLKEKEKPSKFSLLNPLSWIKLTACLFAISFALLLIGVAIEVDFIFNVGMFFSIGTFILILISGFSILCWFFDFLISLFSPDDRKANKSKTIESAPTIKEKSYQEKYEATSTNSSPGDGVGVLKVIGIIVIIVIFPFAFFLLVIWELAKRYK